ncbi:uncharacterized protein LOC130896758 [Diorhabda carinulata]|uniref:uncharacterized protein LOC130896758 n=1 Tax=Diorhabda carinulata TaxID=1163345 RepID=UPI0025A0A72F|nr:uncharacterized protein LOC130896758 [Diorhabda carinulata]
MNKNNKLCIDPAMFTKPPPNFKTTNMVQPFKPDVPPPPYTKNSSPALPSSSSNGAFSGNEDEKNYYLMMLYRYHNSTNTPQHSHGQNSFSSTDVSKSFPLPPPTHFSPRQPPLPTVPPPLPTVPPPQNPPPPSMLSPPIPIAMNNFHNRMSPLYGHSFSKVHNNFKRKFDGNDAQKKLQKKKKKPLSQVVPQRRDWTMEEAKRALEVEKDCNKRSKRQGLIIKFPDLELNRDIVSNFHTSIESVHFQQPSTARYCFVTLTESADPETVINQLNKIPFGLGYLSAEFKKDREDEQNIKPSDIDPLTLYVGNLAQEVTKDDMEKKYPKRKRIDIGYAKKMKYTRYAFVSFHTVDDAIEAFQNTHSSQMYSKSLIVRFRRLHGTVGMPGEPKQASQRFEVGNSYSTMENCNFTPDVPESDRECSQWDIDISNWAPDNQETKYKRSDTPTSEDDENEELDIKPTQLTTRFRPGSLEVAFSLHKPRQIKEEKIGDEREKVQNCTNNLNENYTNEDDGNTNKILQPQSSNSDYNEMVVKNVPVEPEQKAPLVTIKKEKCNNSTTSTYDDLRKINNQIRSGILPITLYNNKSPKCVEIKQEIYNVKKEIEEENNLSFEKEILSCNSNDSNQQSVDKSNSDSRSEIKTNNSTADDTNDDCFGWMNIDYASTVIKTEIIDSDQR